MQASTRPEPDPATGLALFDIRLDHRGGDGRPFRVLDIPELEVAAGARLGLRGASGSGKTSLLHLIAGLASPDHGRVSFGGVAISQLSSAARDRWRRTSVGFVFQEFHLVPELDIAANIALPLSFARWRSTPEQKERVDTLAQRMGLTDLRRKARVLSRGEQQRVAIARALLGRPAMILADEPTASLDASHAAVIGTLLVETAAETGATLICASHDERLLGMMDAVHTLLVPPARRIAA